MIEGRRLCFNMIDMPPNFEPNIQPRPQIPESRPNLPPPVPNPLRQAHSMPVGEQHTVDINNLPKNAGNNLFQSTSPNQVDTDYSFILDSTSRSKSIKLKMPGGKLGKILTGLMIATVMVILLIIITSLLKSPSPLPYFYSVLEDQQELINISSIALNQSDTSYGNQNFASTANLALSSNSAALQSFLTTNGVKVNSAILNAKISPATNNLLTNAENSGNFNATFSNIAAIQLKNYLIDLKVAYSKTTSHQARQILSSQYNQANLLLTSLANGY